MKGKAGDEDDEMEEISEILKEQEEILKNKSHE